MTRVTRKNKNNESRLPLTISAQHGLVDQVTFFNKVVASSDMSNYYLLHKGEFAYNKSYSGDYPWGAIKRLDRYDQGALSSLYICFTPTDIIDSDFLVHYFESPKWHREVSNIAGEGARNHGLLNIAVPDFFNTQHCITTNKTEQRKIADFLNLINERIETQKKIIEDLKKLKDAINNSLHNSIKDYQTFSFNELGNDYCGLKGKSSDDFGSGFPYISYLNVFRNDVVTDEQFDYVKVAIGEKQNIVRDGDLIFTLSSETPSEVGIGAIYQGQTTPLYLNSFCFGVHLSNQEKIHGPYLAYFVTSQYFRRTILPFAQGSTRYNLMKSDFMKHKFCFPNIASQKAIYNALYALSEKIQNEEVCLNKYTEQKQYLLTRLFI